MRKREMKAAVRDHWRVMDDFGVKGSVVGFGADPEHVMVQWPREGQPQSCHYARVNRIEDE